MFSAVGYFLFNLHYRNDPKFSDRYAWANSADPDQTAPREAVWSGSTLFAIPSASFGLITLWYSHVVQILEWLQRILWVSEYFKKFTVCVCQIVLVLQKISVMMHFKLNFNETPQWA